MQLRLFIGGTALSFDRKILVWWKSWWVRTSSDPFIVFLTSLRCIFAHPTPSPRQHWHTTPHSLNPFYACPLPYSPRASRPHLKNELNLYCAAIARSQERPITGSLTGPPDQDLRAPPKDNFIQFLSNVLSTFAIRKGLWELNNYCDLLKLSRALVWGSNEWHFANFLTRYGWHRPNYAK